MQEKNDSLDDIRHIKKMMEQSSRFISLSGWSGVCAGISALLGAWVAHPYIHFSDRKTIPKDWSNIFDSNNQIFNSPLFWIALGTLVLALSTAFLFTYIKSKQEGISMWDSTTKRLLINTFVPLIAGGFFILKLSSFGLFGFIAPACLIFYGLALINGSKYTVSDIEYLGYAQIILGIINLWMIGYGYWLWIIGFGILHIVYGLIMYFKYDAKKGDD